MGAEVAVVAAVGEEVEVEVDDEEDEDEEEEECELLDLGVVLDVRDEFTIVGCSHSVIIPLAYLSTPA